MTAARPHLGITPGTPVSFGKCQRRQCLNKTLNSQCGVGVGERGNSRLAIAEACHHNLVPERIEFVAPAA